MLRVEDVKGYPWLFSRKALLWLWIPIVLISIAHYSTGAMHYWAHDIFRRLYYIPIVLGAFIFGLRGSMAASIVASVIYLPHAFLPYLSTTTDPADSLEKFLEILLYNVVAFITGVLADREYRERIRQRNTARQLAEALDDLKQMERQLIRAGRLQALGELTAGLAHEIKNPLAALKGSAEIISDEIPDGSPRRRMVEIHIKEINRLNQTLEKFLDFARPGNFSLGEVNLCETVDKTVALTKTQAARTAVSIDFQPEGEKVIVNADEKKITQVVLNLLLNAVQASPQNGRIAIKCSYRRDRKKLFGCVSIADQGPGVPEELREKIFNPFFSTKEGGTGLGLSIAARIVDELGGFIKIEDGGDGGATFDVLLPAAEKPRG